ncbi:MAG TPA: class F sortase, partial [Blastococcus sp.]
VGSGLALASASPRADARDIGTAPETSAPAPSTAAPSPEPVPPATVVVPSAPPVPSAPVALALPTTPDPVPLVPVGVAENGALQLPDRPSVLGWYAAGALPGAPAGTALVAGHVDSAEFGAGPLETLAHLRLGDVVEVADAAGVSRRYAVESRTSYPKADLPPEVFAADGPPRLALVTCGGAFDERTGQYADNVVVIAVPAS